jgi:phosphoribosylformylglycinamidine synthase
MSLHRVYVEKKYPFAIRAQQVLTDLRSQLKLEDALKQVRFFVRYDIEGLADEEFLAMVPNVFAEPPVDQFFLGTLPEEVTSPEHGRLLAIAYLSGQFDQRADSAEQCIALQVPGKKVLVRTAQVFHLQGAFSDKQFSQIVSYMINPVDSCQASMALPETLQQKIPLPEDIPVLEGFQTWDEATRSGFHAAQGLAMTLDDLAWIQNYFQMEQRDPTLTEIKVLDTYWSDHCRHTTFLTQLKPVSIEDGDGAEPVKNALAEFEKDRASLAKEGPFTLMDVATQAAKVLRKKGRLHRLEVSEEINAASIEVVVDLADGKNVLCLLQFKNETHNHPTEIEPFGGAATCLGGAIRDPLSGRAYVYQAMRVTGSGDPRESLTDTIPGKLPQRKITREAAQGYSSYGNQIGLATGLVHEIYHPGFKAKRMEVGAVIAAVPKTNVTRGVPRPGDLVILVGGRTGRDGIGGATGSSKEHDEQALDQSAEVQKGDPPTERKLQRFFRNAEIAPKIVRCNDFGAGGVSVAIGELSDGLDIDLDALPKKYEGLNGTELALSESQERMALVIRPQHLTEVAAAADAENLEATVVATVTDSARLRMIWRGQTIVDLARSFLDTNGVQQTQAVRLRPPQDWQKAFETPKEWCKSTLEESARALLSDLNHCSQKGLIEQFDATVGAHSITHPLGGKNRLTPIDAMAAKIPVPGKESLTASLMTFAYDPFLASWSPFHGAYYAVVTSVARLVAAGADPSDVVFSFQEYFQKLGQDPELWGKPLAALLGAYQAQRQLNLAAIGGKDSMSGTFKDLHVPPTLISFAVAVSPCSLVRTPEWRKPGSFLWHYHAPQSGHGLLDLPALKADYALIAQANRKGKISSMKALQRGGLLEGLALMAFGNGLGCHLQEEMAFLELAKPAYGDLLLVSDQNRPLELPRTDLIGKVTDGQALVIGGTRLSLGVLERAYRQPLAEIFPEKVSEKAQALPVMPQLSGQKSVVVAKRGEFGKPRVLLPVFPGTNCELETEAAFARCGALTQTLVFRNRNDQQLQESIQALVSALNGSQTLVLSGGFSAGDEPDGSGKYITAVFRHPKVAEATMDLIHRRKGLVLGICNGFQALIKLGLIPFGDIRPLTEQAPTLTFNPIGRHVSDFVETQVVSNASPWLQHLKPGERHWIPVSNGEGRLIATPEQMMHWHQNQQVATRYVTAQGEAALAMPENPSISAGAIEGLMACEGRVFGKMGHSERTGPYIGINIPGDKDQGIFAAGVSFFTGKDLL